MSAWQTLTKNPLTNWLKAYMYKYTHTLLQVDIHSMKHQNIEINPFFFTFFQILETQYFLVQNMVALSCESHLKVLIPNKFFQEQISNH